ncbi:MAG: trigger factor [Hyphomicrobiales bacterium]
MEITESTSDGLKRELKVVVGAKELDKRLSERLDQIKDNVRLKGFRPGKVPVDHLRKVYGRGLMAEVLEQTVAETSQKALTERKERPAGQPNITLGEDKDVIEKMILGEADLAYTMSFEVLPQIEVTDLSKLSLEKPVAEIPDAEIEKAMEQLVQDSTAYEAKEGAAGKGDRLTIDFEGFIDGKAFDGGKAEDAGIVIGSNTFIPGFEDGLVGLKAGDSKTLDITFPADYGADHLANKPATFNVTVKEVAKPVTPEVTDEFAKNLGFESVAKLRDAVKDRIKQNYDAASRTRVKRQLLDALDKSHDFQLPESLVEGEFEAIWKQITHEMEHAGKTFKDEDTTEEKAREDYRKLAERRVRLGLVLAEIGDKNEVKVTDEEVNAALLARIRQFPGQERQVYEFYQKNPQALAEIRAPIFEEKVVDYVLELAKVEEKKVKPEDLFKPIDEDEAA